MSYKNKQVLKDVNGIPIPQYYDVKSGKFKPLTTENYPKTQDVNIVGNKRNTVVKGNVDVDNFPSDYPDLSLQNKVEDLKNVIDEREYPSDYPDSELQQEVASLKSLVEENKETNEMILSRLDGTFDTQLIGSNVEYRRIETILFREVRTTRFNNATFSQPSWANKAIFYLTVYGISGTFDENEGVALETLLFGIDSARYYGVSHDLSTANRITQITEWAPGIEASNVDKKGGSSYLVAPIHFVSELGSNRIRAQIKGTFDEGEGVDCDIKVAWLRG